MTLFLVTFVVFLVVTLGMALGVILMGRTIKGSCGGLNAIGDADKCMVCKKDIDPDSPLRERLNCPRARKMLERAEAEEARLEEADAALREFNAGRRYSGTRVGRSTSTPVRRTRSKSPDSIGEAIGQALIKELSGTTGKRIVRGVLGGLFKAR